MRPPLTESGGFSGGRRASGGKEPRGRSSGDLGGLGGSEPGEHGGMNGGSKVIVEPYRHAGVFIIKYIDSEEKALATKNLLPGEAVSNEEIISVQKEDGTKVEYRLWNPYLSMLAAAIYGATGDILIKPGSKVLYLGAGYGHTVSHVSDLVGPDGLVYAVEFSRRSARNLVYMAKKRTNVIPIIEDAASPAKYRVVVGMVDVIVSDVAQSDQASILALNASYFLKTEGHFVILIKAKCIDPKLPAKDVFEKECNKLKLQKFSPAVQLTLEPFKRDHACIIGSYRMPKKKSKKKKTEVEEPAKKKKTEVEEPETEEPAKKKSKKKKTEVEETETEEPAKKEKRTKRKLEAVEEAEMPAKKKQKSEKKKKKSEA